MKIPNLCQNMGLQYKVQVFSELDDLNSSHLNICVDESAPNNVEILAACKEGG